MRQCYNISWYWDWSYHTTKRQRSNRARDGQDGTATSQGLGYRAVGNATPPQARASVMRDVFGEAHLEVCRQQCTVKCSAADVL